MKRITATKDGPYLADGRIEMRDSKGKAFPADDTVALCRCGKSKVKPYCDGSHVKSAFSGVKHKDRIKDKVDPYKGKDVTIHDNRGVCSHAGHCTGNVPTVWKSKPKEGEAWIDPDGSDAVDIEAVCKLCPSGALSYTKDGKLHKDYGRGPMIKIAKDGPYKVVGHVELVDDNNSSKPESREHYTLCRCGHSKNKPFCDGSHAPSGFKDDKN